MSKTAFHILRVGLAITFLWIGILILKNPEAWTGFISPRVAELLPVSPVEAMQGTAVLDLIIGALLLFGVWTWIGALLGSLHMISVIIVAGITDITVRDIAVFASAVAILVETWPKNLLMKQKQT